MSGSPASARVPWAAGTTPDRGERSLGRGSRFGTWRDPGWHGAILAQPGGAAWCGPDRGAVCADRTAGPILPAMSEPHRQAPDRRPTPPACRALLLLNAIFPGLGHLVGGPPQVGADPGAARAGRCGGHRPGPLVGERSDVARCAAVRPGCARRSCSWSQALPACCGASVALGAVRRITPLRATTPDDRRAAILSVAIVLRAAARSSPASRWTPATPRPRSSQPVDEGGAWVPDASAPPVASDDPDFGIEPSPSASLEPSASASASPSPTPAIPRVNVLLIGMDSGVGRNTALTDTMIVASLDPVGKDGLDGVDPARHGGRAPAGRPHLPGQDQRPRLLRALAPRQVPGRQGRPVRARGSPGRAARTSRSTCGPRSTSAGFVDLVDSVGGVNVNVTDGFCDPRYKEYGINGFNISPGRYHFDGEHALAYARDPQGRRRERLHPGRPASRRSSPPCATGS